MTLERRIMTECLNLYREFPCLWDNRLTHYANKEAREQAYEVILEKYRQLQEDASMPDLKKRIENMRTSYRREHKKVLLARLNGDDYRPGLWYYDMMIFLNDVMDFTNLEPPNQDNGDVTMKIEFDDDSSSLKRLLKTPQPRAKKRKISTIYMQDQHDTDDEVHEDIEEIQINHNNQVSLQYSQNIPSSLVSEAEAFGTAIGLQLKELNSMQKVYAEKLISDVIYNARLDRLTFNSSLNIDE